MKRGMAANCGACSKGFDVNTRLSFVDGERPLVLVFVTLDSRESGRLPCVARSDREVNSLVSP
jgi:hypothetical protein